MSVYVRYIHKQLECASRM